LFLTGRIEQVRRLLSIACRDPSGPCAPRTMWPVMGNQVSYGSGEYRYEIMQVNVIGRYARLTKIAFDCILRLTRRRTRSGKRSHFPDYALPEFIHCLHGYPFAKPHLRQISVPTCRRVPPFLPAETPLSQRISSALSEHLVSDFQFAPYFRRC
jgi:hypothetical protein